MSYDPKPEKAKDRKPRHPLSLPPGSAKGVAERLEKERAELAKRNGVKAPIVWPVGD